LIALGYDPAAVETGQRLAVPQIEGLFQQCHRRPVPGRAGTVAKPAEPLGSAAGASTSRSRPPKRGLMTARAGRGLDR
jgi:hypothetical protein